MTTEVNRKDRKLPMHWTSKIPKLYKINSITSDLNRALRISSCLNDEISRIRLKFLNADYPLRFINTVIKHFNHKLSEKFNEEDDYILPPDFFEIKEQVILIVVPFYTARKTKQLLDDFSKNFTNSLMICMKSK